MSLRAQFQALGKQGAAMRQSFLGTNASGTAQECSYDGGARIGCYYTPVRTQQQLDEAGFRQLHDTIVRIAKVDEFGAANLATVELGKRIILYDTPQGDLTVQVNEFGNSGANPEWVLGCGNLF